MSRPAPTDDEIVGAITAHSATGFPIKKSTAVEIIRIHFGTTTKKAEEWLDKLTGRDEPALFEAWADSAGISSVLRIDPKATATRYRRIRKGLKLLGYDVSHICIDADGRFVKSATGIITQQSWIMPPDALAELANQQLAADNEQRDRAARKAQAEAEAFEAKHPRVLDRIRAALTGVISDVDRYLYTGVHQSTTRGAQTTLSLTIANGDIDKFAALLDRASKSPSAQE